MSKRTRRTGRLETLTRTISIRSFGASLSVGVDKPEIEVKPWLEIRGTLDAPVNQISEILFSLYPDVRTKVGTTRPPGVGAIIGMRNGVDAVVSVPHAEFDRLWSFAFSGHLNHGWRASTKPKYNKGQILAVRSQTSAKNNLKARS